MAYYSKFWFILKDIKGIWKSPCNMITVTIRNSALLDDRYIVQNNFSRYSFSTVAQNNMTNAFVNKLELEPFNEVLTV